MAGEGEAPAEGQEVVFDYTGYNESGAVIDSTYRKGAPAQTRLGIRGLIPGARTRRPPRFPFSPLSAACLPSRPLACWDALGACWERAPA